MNPDENQRSAPHRTAREARRRAFVARWRRLGETLRRSAAAYQEAARGVRADLAAVGVDIETVDALPRLGRTYPEAVPVLLHWLPVVENVDVKEDIVRALSVGFAKPAAAPLVLAFERAGDSPGLQWAIGNALEVLASAEIADAMLRLAGERRHGRARQMVVAGLGKLKDPRVVDVLVGLLDDPEVAGHAIGALGQLRAHAAVPHLVPFLEHKSVWVRKMAQRALARLGRAP